MFVFAYAKMKIAEVPFEKDGFQSYFPKYFVNCKDL